MEFETVIGLEVHAQMKTKSKIFCGFLTIRAADTWPKELAKLRQWISSGADMAGV